MNRDLRVRIPTPLYRDATANRQQANPQLYRRLGTPPNAPLSRPIAADMRMATADALAPFAIMVAALRSFDAPRPSSFSRNSFSYGAFEDITRKRQYNLG